jgi:hypothetical protein
VTCSPLKILVLHRVPYPFIRYADHLDHTVHTVVYIGVEASMATLPEDLPCVRLVRPGVAELADEVLAQISPADFAGERFDRVIAMSQYDAVGAAQVREALGVVGDRPAQLRVVNDKVAMKRAVAAAGLRVPRFLPLQSALSGEPIPWEGRTVLKPVDGTRSEDVHVFASPQQAMESPVGMRQIARFQLEEFVDGPIWAFDGLMLGGEALAVMASRYLGTCLGYAQGAPLGVVQVVDVDWDEVLPYVRATGIDNGPFHLEMIEAPNGLVFLEIAARPGGGDTVDTFRRVTGLDMQDAWLSILLEPEAHDGHPLRQLPSPPPQDEVYGEFQFPGHLLPTVRSRVVGGEHLMGDPRIVKWRELGLEETLPGHVSYKDFEVPLCGTVRGRSTEEVEATLREIFHAVHIVACGELRGTP